jgi:chromosome segregation ATPase
MSKETEKLRREVRADLALMWANQSDANGRIEQLSRSIEQHADQIAEQGQRIAEQGLVIQASMRQTAALGREVADLGNQLVGRLKQFDKRFGKFLSAVEKDSEERFEALEARVARLEERGDPAA